MLVTSVAAVHVTPVPIWNWPVVTHYCDWLPGFVLLLQSCSAVCCSVGGIKLCPDVLKIFNLFIFYEVFNHMRDMGHGSEEACPVSILSVEELVRVE